MMLYLWHGITTGDGGEESAYNFKIDTPGVFVVIYNVLNVDKWSVDNYTKYPTNAYVGYIFCWNSNVMYGLSWWAGGIAFYTRKITLVEF